MVNFNCVDLAYFSTFCLPGHSELLLLLLLLSFFIATLCQIDSVESCIQKLTKEPRLIVLSVKTRTAARIMLEHYREEMETLAENVRLLSKLIRSMYVRFNYSLGSILNIWYTYTWCTGGVGASTPNE